MKKVVFKLSGKTESESESESVVAEKVPVKKISVVEHNSEDDEVSTVYASMTTEQKLKFAISELERLNSIGWGPLGFAIGSLLNKLKGKV